MWWDLGARSWIRFLLRTWSEDVWCPWDVLGVFWCVCMWRGNGPGSISPGCLLFPADGSGTERVGAGPAPVLCWLKSPIGEGVARAGPSPCLIVCNDYWVQNAGEDAVDSCVGVGPLPDDIEKRYGVRVGTGSRPVILPSLHEQSQYELPADRSMERNSFPV